MAALLDLLHDGAVPVLMVLFLGVLYWGFRPRFRNRKRRGDGDDGHPPA